MNPLKDFTKQGSRYQNLRQLKRHIRGIYNVRWSAYCYKTARMIRSAKKPAPVGLAGVLEENSGVGVSLSAHVNIIMDRRKHA
jgi:formylmethanofuran dehydrogenase subunit B